MARGVGVLGAEGRAEGVHVAKGHGEVLGVELAGHGKRGGGAEEVLAEVHVAVIVQRRVDRVDGGDVEHLAGALAVARGDDGGVHVDEAAILEEAMDGSGGHGAHAEDGAEQVGARAQVLLSAQELHGGALLLQRVVRSGNALDHDLGRGELEGLRGVRRELELAGADERRGDVLMGDLVVVGERLAVHDDLQVLEAAAVVQGDEAEVLHVADGLDPSGNGHLLSAERLSIGVELGDLGAIHAIPFPRAPQDGGARCAFLTIVHSSRCAAYGPLAE